MADLSKHYNHQEVEPRIYKMWEEGGYFTPQIDPAKKPYSIFLTPPNASGGMHIGNVLMIAIQDILARFYRANGRPTLWVPSTDHGGYETQVTFERELEKVGKSRLDFSRSKLFSEINSFVEKNNELIKTEIRAAGASVDWSRFRYTMDDGSLQTVDETFKKMVRDNLIYRRPYMVNYCASCGTVLADIELKEIKQPSPLYAVRFYVKDSDEYLVLTTAKPEFLFSVTHVLAHPADQRFSRHIGKILNNPITGEPVEVIASKRKFDPLKLEPTLTPFCPSHVRYDYEYTLRNKLPSRNLLDWDGKMLERYPGLLPSEARVKEAEFLEKTGKLESINESYQDSVFLCKRGHQVQTVIMLTWFLKLDDNEHPLRQPAIDVVTSGKVKVYPRWREKGLVEWLGKMHDWPIARQNVWGIKMPIWYEVSDPAQFTVWFWNQKGERCSGNLKQLLDEGIAFDDIVKNLERVYAGEGVKWVLEPEDGKIYLPETDTFDTWFSSSQLDAVMFGEIGSTDFKHFYPCETVVIGHDLLRLSISREILLCRYMTGLEPFRSVYLHRLIKGADGQKMSKSLGNSVSLEHYLTNYGADVTRMALISYTTIADDFVFEESQLKLFQEFSNKLWQLGRSVSLVLPYAGEFSESLAMSSDDRRILEAQEQLATLIRGDINKLAFAFAQEKVCLFVNELERYLNGIVNSESDNPVPFTVLKKVFEKYLILLHPFAPFITEELHANLFGQMPPLAAAHWPEAKSRTQNFGHHPRR